MKPYEYRYQVRTYQMVRCEECGHLFKKYGETIWDEPVGRAWPENLRVRSAGENGERAWASKGPFGFSESDGYSVGRFYDQHFHEDYHVSSSSGPLPRLGVA